jgi:RimJ/RimL family protein N-acetyltransferase
MPDLQPTLVGQTVIIRPLREENWPELFAAASDPLIWALHPARDRYKEDVFRAFFDDAMALKSAFAFVDKEPGALIGSSRYYGYDSDRSEIEIGWTFLVRQYWGGNTNREIKRLMLDHAFTFVDTVVFWVGAENWRSQRAMEKIGGVRRDGLVFRPPSTAPNVVFEITKPGLNLSR